MNTDESIPKLVAKAIKNADRTEKWTAQKAGIAETTFYRKMKGTTEFTCGEVARVARALSVAAYTLLPEEFQQEVAA